MELLSHCLSLSFSLSFSLSVSFRCSAQSVSLSLSLSLSCFVSRSLSRSFLHRTLYLSLSLYHSLLTRCPISHTLSTFTLHLLVICRDFSLLHSSFFEGISFYNLSITCRKFFIFILEVKI